MDQIEKGTQDFMNVESFSQLPFIRSAPSTTGREKGFRLFGKEVGRASSASAINATATDSDSTEVIKDQISSACDEANNKDNNNNISGDSSSSRKFECHYCCRNFPTSQALGGHQNAHKRERQHAKRAHLHSALAHNCYSEARIYNLMNYSSRQGLGSGSGSAPPPSSQATISSYPTWNTTSYNTIASHHYPSYLGIGNSTTSSSAMTMNNSPASSHSQHHQPLINGSPLGLWRIPSVQPAFNRDRPSHHHHQLPLFSKDDHRRTSLKVGDPSSSPNLFIYETKPNVQDPVVSLDLRL